jgi:hypothetical protein
MYRQNWTTIGASSPLSRLRRVLGSQDGFGFAAGDEFGQDERDQDHAQDHDEGLAHPAEEEAGHRRSAIRSTSLQKPAGAGAWHRLGV